MSSIPERTIGVVILNYKSYLDTETLVHELLSNKTKHRLIIQIVDNASPNDSFSYLWDKFKDVSDVYVNKNNENSGFACGNNFGLKLLAKYSPDYALVLNNDVHFDTSILDKLVTVYESINNVGAVAPLQCYPSGQYDKRGLAIPNFINDFFSYTYIYYRLWRDSLDIVENTEYKGVRKVGIIPGCFIFIDYALFESIGFFSEDTFLFCEERFLARKLKDIGRSNYLLLDCHFIHDHSKTINDEASFLRQLGLLHDGRVAYTRRYRKFASLKVALLNLMWFYQSNRVKLIAFLRKNLFQ